MTSGSSTWQAIFVSFAAVVILLQVARGWRLGLLRQLMRIGAVIAAYAAAWFGGPLLVPIGRPLLKAPDFILSIIGGAILALVVYSIITSIGTILFKKTSQQKSGAVKLVYGLTGAALGVIFGAFLVWLLVVGVRSLGSVAETQLQIVPATADATEVPERRSDDLRRRSSTDALPGAAILESLARLKNSVELGSIGGAVKAADIVPPSTYEALGKVGRVVSNPESAERFLSYPGAKDLSENPKIIALRDDPEIIEMIAQGKFFDLLGDPRIIAAANDPELAALVRTFEFQKAIDYALKN